MIQVFYGVLGGLIYALTGYLKSGEKFNTDKMLRTIILGAVVGLFNSLAGVSMDGETITMLLSAGEVAVAENLLKSLVKISRL